MKITWIKGTNVAIVKCQYKILLTEITFNPCFLWISDLGTYISCAWNWQRGNQEVEIYVQMQRGDGTVHSEDIFKGEMYIFGKEPSGILEPMLYLVV